MHHLLRCLNVSKQMRQHSIKCLTVLQYFYVVLQSYRSIILLDNVVVLLVYILLFPESLIYPDRTYDHASDAPLLPNASSSTPPESPLLRNPASSTIPSNVPKTWSRWPNSKPLPTVYRNDGPGSANSAGPLLCPGTQLDPGGYLLQAH